MSELVDAAGGLKGKIAKAISGGPMMGFALYDLHVPCTKTTSAFLFLEHDAVRFKTCGKGVQDTRRRDAQHTLPVPFIKGGFGRVCQSGNTVFAVIATHAVDEQMDGAVFAFRRVRGQFQHEVLDAHDLAVHFDARDSV